jgi:hypothetical protein
MAGKYWSLRPVFFCFKLVRIIMQVSSLSGRILASLIWSEVQGWCLMIFFYEMAWHDPEG